MGKLKCGVPGALSEVRKVQGLIKEWFREEAEKIKVKAGIEDITESESVQIYQHKIHKKVVKKSAILELHTESGVKLGHKECAETLAESVKSFLCDESPLNSASQETLLNEIDVMFTEEDNLAMTAPPTMEEVFKVVKKANHSITLALMAFPAIFISNASIF